MTRFLLTEDKVITFIEHLQKQKNVFAPHKRGTNSFAFEQVSDPASVMLDYTRTLHSVKKYFMPPREQLLSFSLTDNSFAEPTVDPVDAIFLGVHSYDLQAVFKLDHNFSEGNPEKNYLKRREGALFVGVTFAPDQWHFSGSVGINPNDADGFDVFLFAVENGYAVEAFTPAGESLLSGFEMSEFNSDIPAAADFNQHIYVPQGKLSEVFDNAWDNEVWEETSKECVGCGTCNMVCPTCYCFNVEDGVDVTATVGQRERHWDACMTRDFSEVAGGEVFREELAARQRHRVSRKFKYISDKTGQPWCVGCGRCTASCSAKISIVNIVNKLVQDHEQATVAPV